MATKGKKVEIYYTSQGTTTGIDASALIFDGKNLAIHTHEKVFKGTDTTYSANSASGLSLSGTQFSLNVGTKDSTNASSAAGFTSGRFYQVVPDKNNKLGVVVPWEDHNDNTWLPLSASQAGYAPKASGGIDSQDSSTYYFLGYTGSSINWFKLPANAFKNNTYHVYNGSFTIFGNGTSVASTSANASADSSVNIVAGSNVTITPDATNKKITIASKDTNTWDPVTSTVDGYVPKIGTAAASTIATQADEWVLASTKGGTPSWRKLPANAFKNDDTTYSFYNLAFQNTAGDTVDTYKPSTSPSKTFKAGSANVLISAASNVISIDTKDTKYSDFVKSGSGAAAGLVPKPSTTAGTTKFLREDGTWSVPSYTEIPNNNVTGSGTSGYIAKFSGANTITNGPAFGTGTTFLRNDGTWQTPTNTWTAADVNNAGYVPKSVKGKFLHANASSGALEWVDDNNTNTWRDIKGNGTSITSTAALNIKPGDGISISVSGGDITITNSKPDQDHNTDKNVSQANSDTNQESPVLVKNGTGTGTVTKGVIFADGVTINPSTNSLSISGSLSVSGTASFGNNVKISNTTQGSVPYINASNELAFLAPSSTNAYVLAYNTSTHVPYWKADANTNNKTAQNISTANNTYPILLGYTANATKNIGNQATLFGSGIKANPSTSTISCSNIETTTINGDTPITSGNISSQTVANATNCVVKSGDTMTGDLNTTGVSATGTSNRLIFRHLDGQNCNGNYNLYLNYYNGTSCPVYFCGSSYYINGGYYNGTAAVANSVSWSNVTSKPGASGNATTPVYWNGSGFTNCTAYGSASVNYANSAGNADTVDNRHATGFMYWEGSPGKSNMNDIARSFYSSTGMTNLTSSSVDNGDMSGWTHFISTSYADGGNGSNAWCFQLACPAGSSNLQFRSRSGGTVTNGTSWNVGWTKIIHAGNIGSQSVNYASSAGNADTLDGAHNGRVTASKWWTTSHVDDWYERSDWDGSYFWLKAMNGSGSTLPSAVAYSSSAGSVAWGNVTSKPNFGVSWNGYPVIGNDGVIEIGKYIDFHASASDTSDYCFRLTAASGSLTGSGSFYANSDRHKKKHIQSIDRRSLIDLFEVSDKLLKQFTWKVSGKTSYGFIAQQLEKYVPEAVSQDNEGIKSVSYDIAYAKILASMIHEIKKLKALIEDNK